MTFFLNIYFCRIGIVVSLKLYLMEQQGQRFILVNKLKTFSFFSHHYTVKDLV